MQLRRALGALRRGRVLVTADELVQPERTACRLPVAVRIEHVETEPAFIGCAVRADEDATEALARDVARWLGLQDRRRHEVVRKRPHCGAEQRYVDECRFAAAFAAEQRGRNAAGKERAARTVAERAAGLYE